MRVPKLSAKDLKRFQDLWARIFDPASASEEIATARTKLNELLKKNGLTRHDLPKIIAEIERERIAAEEAAAAATRAAAWKKGPDGGDLGIPGNNLLGLMLRLIEGYISVTEEERLAISLWVLHTHVFRHFHHTPRLLVISPIEECGKTTVLKVIMQLAYEPARFGGVTAAMIYHQLESTPGITLLIDEADNLALFNDRKMRQIFNYGHETYGADIGKVNNGRPQKYSVSAPVALGTIQELPRPLMSRSIAIRMRRSANQLKPFDENDRAFMIVREAIQKWGARCNLNRNPAMPAGFRGRTADNWRPLLAIADDLGFGYGETARAAAVVLSSDRQYENQHVTLLTDIRTVFDRLKRDRLRTKAELIPVLAGLEDSLWGEWTGPDGTATPHMLSQGDIGRLLRPFGIRSKTVWPPGRRQDTKSDAGYYRPQFEAAWASYCEPSATPPQANEVRYLSRP
jgi:hypothetical protein